MIRAILELVLALFLIALLRYLLSTVGSFFRSGSPARSGARSPASQTESAGGELKKDPVCGTYVSAATSLKKTVHGEVIYFCSADCRSKYEKGLKN